MLERAISEVIRRHEILRTTFVAIDGRPFQLVAPTLDLKLTVVKAHGRRKLEDVLVEESGRGFDLGRGPLLRVTVVRMPKAAWLVVAMHHIVTDGWSMNILSREILTLYEAFSLDAPSPLAELEIQYADYSVWQHYWLKSDNSAIHSAYWKQQLAGLPPLMELPLDHPRPAEQTFAGSAVPVAISPAVRRRPRPV